MRILLSGGGTAGHINPALAIAEIVKGYYPDAEIIFVGTPHGMENRLVAQAGYPMRHVDVRGFSRSLSPKNLGAMWLALTSPHKAGRILDELRPDAVIGTGGYVCYPILRAAAGRGIPTAVHESNALPGLAVKALSRTVDRVWLNFAESARHLPKGCPISHTGNPLRAGFKMLSRDAARAKLGISPKELFLLSFGGSLGADAINEAIFNLYRRLHLRLPRLSLLHICGERHYPMWKDRFTPLSPRARLLPYLHEMPLYMAAADIVVARAGAMTVSELAYARKCAILVPSPYVTGNHQYENAAALANAGAAALVEERELSSGRLSEVFEELVQNPEKRRAAERKIGRFSVPDTEARILREIESLFAKKRKKRTNL